MQLDPVIIVAQHHVDNPAQGIEAVRAASGAGERFDPINRVERNRVDVGLGEIDRFRNAGQSSPIDEDQRL